MTSETTEKKQHPIVVPASSNPAKDNRLGVAVILASWVYLYFAVFTTLYDGLKDFLWLNTTRLGIELATNTIAPIIAAAAGGEVEFGSLKFYGLCGFGGILSCGITHTAIVPLDLVKCRIQVC